MLTRKSLFISGCIIIALFVGCATATSSFTNGKDFDSTKIKMIEKNKTSQDDIIKMLGQPFYKTVISASEEKWIYTFQQGNVQAQSNLITTKAQTIGTMKTLDILLKDGIVTNFTYNEGPMEGSMNMGIDSK